MSISANNEKHGGEQGMEPGEMQLPQDYNAAYDAINGWCKDSKTALDDRMSWFNDAKFGCFIHWGPYSSLESVWNGRQFAGYAEHIMRMAKIPVKTYKDQVVKNFNPCLFDGEEWMLQAKKAGMKYFVITAKHHDGFAMWHSDSYAPHPDFPSYEEGFSGYDMRLTKFSKRDPIMELRDAAKRHGIKFGLYYSHTFDWEHPYAPGNDWDDFSSINGFTAGRNPGGDKLHGTANWWTHDTYKDFDIIADNYVTNKSKSQIRELVEKYDPDLMWFDTPHKLPLYQNIEIAKFLRGLKPDIVINGRLARWPNYQLGDYENSGDRASFFFPLPVKYWETIPTTNDSYGFSSVDNSHKPPSHFIRILGTAASKGGNVLLNVGPMGNGKWDPKDTAIFNAIGAWMEKNGESIYGTERTNDIPIPNWGAITKKGNKLYLHVHQWPADGVLWLGSLQADMQAQFLVSGKTIPWLQQGKDIKMEVGTACPDTDSTVIVLTINGSYTTYPQRLLDPLAVNSLYAFDAILTGNFSRGDGKVATNHLGSWQSNEQYISWNVSLREQKAFNFQLQYNGSDNSGTVCVEITGTDNVFAYSYDINYSDGGTGIMSPAVPVTLPSGDYVINIKGKTLKGEHLRPRAMVLTPQ
jgi:alpha-L-fucosidase